MARKNRKKGNTVTVDFSDVQSNVVLPEAEGCSLKVVSAAHKENDGDGAIVVRIQVLDSDNKKMIGKETQIYFNLGETSLWVLRNFLDALGVEIPEGPMDIDLDSLTDMEFVADITQNTYNDRTSNRLANFQISEGGESEEEEDEDEVVVKGKKSKKAKDEEDDDEEEEAPKSRKSKKSKEDDEEDEDEEEEPKSKKKSRKSKDDEEDDEEDEAPKKKSKKGTTYTESDVRDMDEKELKAIVKKHDLDVDLDDYGSTRKKAMAVVDALDEAGMIESD